MSNQFKYDQVVYIGRFQIPHSQHFESIRQCLELGKRLIIGVGSSFAARTPKNPFKFDERVDMLKAGIPKTLLSRISFVPITDHPYDDTAWATEVQIRIGMQTQPGDKIALFGHDKDESSFYLKMFPQWDSEKFQGNIVNISATNLRDLYYRGYDPVQIDHICMGVVDYLIMFKNTPAYTFLVKEYEFLLGVWAENEKHKYPPIFCTGDSLVIQSGHILVIERGGFPGKGLLALPGGYMNAKTDKTMTDAAIRELHEETRIDVPKKVLYGSIEREKLFQDINRSERGRIITMCVTIRLPDGPLPKVKPRDDAKRAFWLQTSQIDPEDFFEDHAHIIYDGLGQTRF